MPHLSESAQGWLFTCRMRDSLHGSWKWCSTNLLSPKSADLFVPSNHRWDLDVLKTGIYRSILKVKLLCLSKNEGWILKNTCSLSSENHSLTFLCSRDWRECFNRFPISLTFLGEYTAHDSSWKEQSLQSWKESRGESSRGFLSGWAATISLLVFNPHCVVFHAISIWLGYTKACRMQHNMELYVPTHTFIALTWPLFSKYL